MNQPTMPTFVKSLPLPFVGDCSLLGAAPDLEVVYVEMYGANHESFEQIGVTLAGDIVVRGDETTPLEPTPGLVRPRSAWMTMALNFAGARHRGIRAEERIDDLAHPLTVPEKMQIATLLRLSVPAPMILGWIESYALAEAQLSRGVYCVCRRLRIAYALSQPGRDHEGSPIDYDSAVLYIAHIYQPHEPDNPHLSDLLRQFGDAPLRRPTDCMVAGRHLLIVDSGDDDQPAHLHLWALTPDDADAREQRKLYT